MTDSLASHPDRLFPADPGTRKIARELYADVEHFPILSPHGHVPAEWIADDVPFPDPTALLVTPDHYVTRLIHASGVPLGELGFGEQGPEASLEGWRRFAEAWPLFDGTASGYWLRSEFEHVFALPAEMVESFGPENADAVYGAIAAKLAEPDFRPRKLFEDFNIEVLATTDDPLDSLEAHERLAKDETFRGRVVPTFRPDAYINVAHPEWAERVERLTAEASGGVAGFAGYLRALENRRRYFVEHGAVSADHGVRTPLTLRLEPGEAEAL
ncbi:glucuronate isomerase, partial [Sinomonas humi]